MTARQEGCERDPEPAEPVVAREEIADETIDGEAGAERRQSGERGDQCR